MGQGEEMAQLSPEMTDDDVAATLGYITTVSEQMMPKPEMEGETEEMMPTEEEPIQEEEPTEEPVEEKEEEPEGDLEGKLDEKIESIVVQKLEEMLNTDE